MKRVLQLFVLAAIGALLVPALATAAPRMYVGFHDDPNFRYEARRAGMLDQARSHERNDRAHTRHLGERRPAAASERRESVRPRLPLRRSGRARAQRAGRATWRS